MRIFYCEGQNEQSIEEIPTMFIGTAYLSRSIAGGRMCNWVGGSAFARLLVIVVVIIIAVTVASGAEGFDKVGTAKIYQL